MADLELTPAHGGQALLLARLLGRPLSEILDFSASINPLGPPAAALAAAQEALAEVQHYPESDAASLRQALAAHHGLPEHNLLVGNGSTELLYLLPRLLQPRRALIVTPAFSEYRSALQLAGAEVIDWPLPAETGFILSAPELIAAARSTDVDMLVVANPGNPTGVGIPPEELLAVADGLDGRCSLAVDEAFVDFSPRRSLLTAVPTRRNLFVFRSLTKFYAIPGLRVGFLAGPDAAMALLRPTAPPWSLNTPALAAARACLAQADYGAETLRQIPLWRQALAAGLTDLGCMVQASEANYLLARLPLSAPDAPHLTQQLGSKGILIRDCTNFPPLSGRYIRVAVRKDEENRQLLTALRSAFVSV
jgi:threonine-phosphate decarboxylase